MAEFAQLLRRVLGGEDLAADEAAAFVGEIMDAIRELHDPQRRRPKAAPVAEESLVMREYNEALVRKLEERNEKLEKANALGADETINYGSSGDLVGKF